MARIFDRVMAEPWLRDEIVQKFPKGGPGDIRLGSPCIVNPGEVAVFVRSGEALGTFQPGTHVLTTANLPLLEKIVGAAFSGDTPFTADVYFVKTTDMTFKWGTTAPIVIEHFTRPPGASAIIGNGTYVAKVKEPWRFLNAMDAFRESVRLVQLKDRLDPMLGVMMQDKMSELAIAKDLGPAQLQSFSQDLNDLLSGMLQTDFDAIGMTMIDFNIRMGLHPDSLEVVSRMGYGTSYTQMKTLDVGMAAAESGSGAGLGELGIGMMGLSAVQQQQNYQQQQQQAPQQPAQQQAAAASQMPDILTPAQAAEFVQVSESDILEAIEAGDLKARKIGKVYRISKESLDAFLAG
ncbi:MAG TPA: SPFH domain-containing protein [candidate division Zixibacteria bacterium]|nr:SPFH domain-containing protein [candidate division Zixibacteria bacterium]